MRNLTLIRPAFEQIAEACMANMPIYFDVREEAAGDKIAALNVARWISSVLNSRITILEAPNGRTPFMLSKYKNDAYSLDHGVVIMHADPYEQFEGLNIHTKGNNDALWFLNYYLINLEERARLSLIEPKPRTDKIVFCALLKVDYNERRAMSPKCIAKSIEALKSQFGDRVILLTDTEHPDLPEHDKYTLDECVELLATSAVVIAGDTGFSHIAAAFGTSLVSLYPDWNAGYINRLSESIKIAKWWGLPTVITQKSFYPNADPDAFDIVEIGTDHSWSIVSMLEAVVRFASAPAPVTKPAPNIIIAP
jgi:hypothetical protein